jgi:hypothetical protein
MQFLNRRAIAAYLAFGLVAFMTACGGYGGQSSADKKAATTVAQVQMFPAPSVSLRPGEVQQMSAAALNVNGAQVFTATISFSSSNPAIQITQNGLLCAGRWDSLTTHVVCFAPGTGPVTNPPTPPPDPAVTAAGITSNITASAAGVSSPVTVASVHLAITSIAVSPTAPACITEKGTQIFTAQAFNGATDITPSVGAFNWTSANVNVATIPATGDTGQTSQATATAVHPGQTNITASIGTVTPISSVPVVFTQCLVKTIAVTVGTPDSTKTPPEDASHFTLATSASRALTATVMDSTGATLTTLPTLNWTTTQPSIAAVNGSGSVNGVAPGVVGISAACVPNNCNIGSTLTVTSNAVSGTVTGTAPTSATAYVTCKTDDHMATTPVCTTAPTSTTTQTQLFPISGTTVGTAINLPHTPNSMMINPQNSKIYLGSSAGLMVVDAGANAFSTTVINAPGSVLTVAPNGSAVVVSSGTDVFLYNGNTVALLLNGTKHILGATAAGFSPDSTKLLISTNTGQLWFETPSATPNHNDTVATATSIAFFPSGKFGAASRNGSTDYIDPNPDLAGKPVVDSGQTCGGLLAQVPTLDAATQTDQLLAADPSGTMCLLNTSTTVPPINTFTVPGFTASQLLISPDGTHAYLIGATGAVQDYAIGSTTLTPITLSPATTITAGGITTNNTIYVGAFDGTNNTVHQLVFAGGVPTGAVTDTPITTTIPADLVVTKK